MSDHFPRQVRAQRHDAESLANRDYLADRLRPALFAIRLPFDLPCPDDSYFVLRRSLDPDEMPWVELTVRRVNVSLVSVPRDAYVAGLRILFDGAAEELAEGQSWRQTWVLALTSNALFEDEPRSVASASPTGFTSIAFERCLRATNLLVQTGQLLTGDGHSRSLSKEGLDSRVAWFEVDPITAKLGEMHELQLHGFPINPVFRDDVVTEAFLDEIGEALVARLQSEAAAQPHPLLLPRYLALQAQAELRYGNATAAITTLHTAVEGLLRGLYRLLIVDSGGNHDAVESASTVTFKSLVTTHLPAYLGGNWNGDTSPARRYLDRTYEVRNGIVHAGRAPSWEEINPAFEAFEAVLGFLDKRIKASWRSHKRTLVAWTDAWAGGTMDLPRRAEQVAQSLRSEAQPYWLPADLAER